jgi:hypothetical protein
VTDAVPFHTGFAVVDLAAATALHSGLGVQRWVFSGWFGRLVTGFGPDTPEVIPRPPDRLLAG